MKRVLLIALAALLLLVTAAAGGALYLLNSRDGLTRAIHWSAFLLPGTLTVETVSGRLRGPLRLEGVHYRDDQREVRLDRLELAWRPAALLDRIVHIQTLSLSGLQMVQTAPAPAGKPGAIRLPVAVIVEHFDAQELSFQGADQAPRRIDRIALNARLDQTTLIVHALELQAPEGELQAQGTLRPSGRYRVDLATTWRLTLPDRPELRGSGRLEGDLRRLTISQTLQAPAALTVEATLENPLDEDLRWSARSRVASLDLRPWRKEFTTPLRDVALALEGTRGSYRGNISLAYPVPELGPVRLTTQVSGTPREVLLTDLLLAPQDHPLRVRLDARLDLAAARPSATITGRWDDLRWPLRGAPRIASPQGRFELAGRTDAYRVSVQAPLQMPDTALGAWRVDGAGDTGGLRLESIVGHVADGAVEGSGSVRWRGGLYWETTLRAAGIDPATYAAAWPGRLRADLTAGGELIDGRATTRVALTDASGTLRGFPASATAELTITPEGARITAAELRSGSAHIAFDGRIGEELDLGFRLNAAALNDLLPVVAGRGMASGRLRGTVAAPRLEASVDLAGLALETAAAARVRGEISADLAAAGRIASRLTAETVTLGGQTFDRVTLNAEGRTANHTVRLSARGAGSEAALTLAGGYGERRWRGTLSEGRWQHPAVGAWTMLQSTALELGLEAVRIAPHCWRQTAPQGATTAATLCLDADWARAAAWQLNGRVEQIPLALLNPLLPGGAMISGPLEGRFRLQGTAQASIEGEARLNLDPGSLYPGRAAAEAQALSHRGGKVELRLVAGRLDGRLDLALEAGGTLSGDVMLEPFDPRRPAAPDTALSGTLRLGLPDLDLFAALLPRLAIGPGSAEARLVLGGRLAAPELQGSVALRAEQIEVAAAGILLKDLRVTGTSRDGHNWELAGSVMSGGGRLEVEGSAELNPARGWPARLRLRGERFEAVNLRDYWVLVSPDLTLNVNKERLEIEGELRIPEAQLRPRRGGSEAVAVSRDAVIVGDQGPAATSPLPALYARIRLILGDKVEFSGFGLSSRITGQLAIEDVPDSAVKGNGELRVVQGAYKSYGQNLEVESGRLTFAGGPVDNPGIDARAVRRSGDVTTGILLRGTLRNPQVTLFSTPAMPQADILSYLVLGVPVSQADQQSGGSSLLATAAALGYVADSPLVRQIRRGLGIEELRIESDTERESVAVVLGRYLSPRLYVSYSVGLTENESAFRIRYKLGRNWTLETESGTQSGADLRYVIEK